METWGAPIFSRRKRAETHVLDPHTGGPRIISTRRFPRCRNLAKFVWTILANLFGLELAVSFFFFFKSIWTSETAIIGA